jgi:2'-5' RNA ligase
MSNHNSYLSLSISEEVRQQLYGIANKFQRAISTLDGQQTFGFEPMKWEDLHITFFFAGENLHSMSSHELILWHDGIQAIIADVLGKIQTPIELQFTGFDIFPPEKSNLIVAKFDASPELFEIQSRVELLTSDLQIGNSGSLRRMVELNSGKCGKWQPHCTLGKIRAPKHLVADVGRKAIEQIDRSSISRNGAACDPSSLQSSSCHHIIVQGLEMSGYMPRQQWIDWMTTLSFM